MIPPDVKERVIDIPNDFTGYDKRDFELTDEETEMVQAVLITNDEIKARCAEMAKQICDDYKGKKLTVLGFQQNAEFFYTDLVDAINAERERRNTFEKPDEDVQIEMSFKDATLYWCEEDPQVLARQLELPENEHVLFVMEYFDSGTTMMKVLKTLTHYSRDLENKG